MNEKNKKEERMMMRMRISQLALLNKYFNKLTYFQIKICKMLTRMMIENEKETNFKRLVPYIISFLKTLLSSCLNVTVQCNLTVNLKRILTNE